MKFVNEKPSAVIADLTIKRNFVEQDGVTIDTNPDGTMTNLMMIKAIPGDVISEDELVHEATEGVVQKATRSQIGSYVYIILGCLLVMSVIIILIIHKIKKKQSKQTQDMVGVSESSTNESISDESNSDLNTTPDLGNGG